MILFENTIFSCFSVFHTEDWNISTQWPDNPGSLGNQSICWYRGLNEPQEPYERKDSWWHVFAARLAFVLAFQVGFYSIYENFYASLIKNILDKE